MDNGRKRIALIYGGAGREHSVSVDGAEFVRGIIDRERYEVLPVFIDTGGGFSLIYRGETVPTFPVRLGGESGFLLRGGVLRVDCAIPLLHGDFGEDGRVQGALDTAGIPFTCADTLTGAVASDKAFTRAVAESLDIPMARARVLKPRATDGEIFRAASELSLPVFIKPTRLGSSIGAGAVYGEGELIPTFRRAARFGCDVLIEELIEGKRELEIGVLATRSGIRLSTVGEVICDGFYDFEKKYRSDTLTLTRADIPEWVEEKIREYATALTGAICLRGTGRLDFFLSGDRLIFNEINTLPGFTRDSLYPRLMREVGITEGELFTLLIEDAMGEAE